MPGFESTPEHPFSVLQTLDPVRPTTSPHEMGPSHNGYVATKAQRLHLRRGVWRLQRLSY